MLYTGHIVFGLILHKDTFKRKSISTCLIFIIFQFSGAKSTLAGNPPTNALGENRHFSL